MIEHKPTMVYKVEVFQVDFPGRPFPWYRLLDEQECANLRAGLERRIGNVREVQPRQLLWDLWQRATSLDGDPSDEAAFDPRVLMESLGLVPGQRVYLDWSPFTEVYEMRFNDFVEFFHSLYFPSADDLTVFDDTLSWILWFLSDRSLALTVFGPDTDQKAK